MKMIDKIITAYKAKKLMLQAQQVQKDGIKETRDLIYNNPRADKQNKEWDDKEEKKIKDKMLYDDLKKRMSDAYQKNKRQKKIDKLQAIKTHWRGLS